MARWLQIWLLIWLAVLCAAHHADAQPKLTAVAGAFVLDTGNGRVLRSADLVGAVLQVSTETGAVLPVRIEGIRPHPQVPGLMLHDFRVQTAPGVWAPLCSPDALGLRMGFPVAGGWDASHRFVADPERLFVTCTSGAQGKCVIFGYDPWQRGPGGESLVPLYEACQHMVRAAYCNAQGTTTDGTTIDFYDRIGIARPQTGADPGFAFEAGWDVAGAVCVDHPRHPEVITLAALRQACPSLARLPACNEPTATAAGAILFNRSRLVPLDP